MRFVSTWLQQKTIHNLYKNPQHQHLRRKVNKFLNVFYIYIYNEVPVQLSILLQSTRRNKEALGSVFEGFCFSYSGQTQAGTSFICTQS